MAGSTVPDLIEKSTAFGSDVIYITDGINDYQITLTRIFNYINANITGITEAQLSLADNTTNNSSTAKHGFVPKLPNDATKFYNGVGAYAVPPDTTGITNSAGNNVIPKSDGTNLIASRISDNNSNVDIDTPNSQTRLGDVNGNGAGTFLYVNDSDQEIGLNSSSNIFNVETTITTSTKPIQVNNTVVLKDGSGNRLLTDQQSFISDPAGGVVIDAECRAVVQNILTLLGVHGLMATP